MEVSVEKHIAIVLAGGNGSRMKSSVPKQYMLINEKPVIYYSLKMFEDSFVDSIILVCKEGEEKYCKEEIVDRFGLKKVVAIIAGGKERYDSVYMGLQQVENADYVFIHDGARYDSVYNGLLSIKRNLKNTQDTKKQGKVYVYIHDGARPCIDMELLEECKNSLLKYNACVPAVPVKDTIKIVDENGFVGSTPDRSSLMAVQTPQCFEFNAITCAYDNMYKEMSSTQVQLTITDDAMVAETFGKIKIKLCKGAYSNIKITTQEDIIYALKALK